MTRVRSPGYPSISLPQAIDITRRLHEKNRSNPTDREAAAKDIGYSGLTGQSAKILSSLQHYGLVEKAGKGGLRVSRIAVDIIHPANPGGRNAALREAASSPDLFNTLATHFSDGIPSENTLRSYLMRENFSSAAIPSAVMSFIETYRFLQQEGVGSGFDAELETSLDDDQDSQEVAENMPTAVAESPMRIATPQPNLAPNERIVYVEEGGPGQYLKLVASGDVDDYLLEAIEDFVKRQRKRLSRSAPQDPN